MNTILWNKEAKEIVNYTIGIILDQSMVFFMPTMNKVNYTKAYI